MNHKILALLLTVILGFAGSSFAQSARESTHIVRPGETLAVIAARYEVDLNDLAALNGIYNYHRIYSWQELEIPSLPDEEALIAGENRSHVIRYGETLGTIAQRYGVDLTELKKLNDLYGKAIYPGHELLLPSPADSSAIVPNEPQVTAQSRQHIVRHGETLGTIAAAYGISLNELILVNGAFNHIIYPGQTLTLPDADGRTLVNPATSAPAMEPPQPITLGGRLSYIVRAGDTLGDLAKHFGITWPAIMRANDIIYPHHIVVGQHLWIPSTGSAALNVADVEPAPGPDPTIETVDAETTESPAETSEAAPDAPPPGDYFEHTVQHGETLGILAIHYGVTFHDLLDANDIIYPYHIYVGQHLWIPATAAAERNVADVELPDPPIERADDAETTESPAETSEAAPDGHPPGDYFEHTVQHGETLGILAIHYGVTFHDLLAANDIIYPYHIYVGQHLWIPATAAAERNVADVELPDPPAETVDAEAVESPAETSEAAPDGPPPGDYFEHTVQHGETLGILAIHYGVTFHDLLAANDIIYPYHIYVGQHLWIPSTGSAALNVADVEPAPVPDPPIETIDAETAESPAETSEPAAEPSQPIKLGNRLSYVVRAGDTLGDLARHFGITWPAIMSANDIIYPYHIYVGQHLWIPSTGSAALNVADVEPAPVPDSPIETIDAETAESPAETSEAALDGSPPGDYFEHTIQHGETLGILAIHYGLTVQELLAANDIIHPNYIVVGQQLWIPSTAAAGRDDADVEPAPGPDSPTETADAETAESPAETSEAAPDGPPPGDYFEHTIQLGETLGVLAIHYGLTVKDLQAANSIDDANRIESGQTLWIPGSAKRRDPPPPPQLPEPAQQPATEVATAPPAPAPQTQNAPVVAGTRQQYVVRKGDFLTQLGIDLDTSWIALARLNNLQAPYVLHTGSTLLIPQRADVELYDPAYAAWKWFDIFAHQPGPQVGVGREIVVLLDAQAIYAYENGVLQKAVRVSTGKKATPTVKGNHKIWLKRRSQTMSGPGYSLDNVEWVMYFYRDYAIHGTWWHTNFGQPMSHGCVNLTNADAQWFYEFASLGTPVHVR